MGLATEVYEQIRRYVWGVLDSDAVSDWLDEHAQEIHDAGDADLRQLTDLTYSLLEDVFQQRRSDEEARAALQEVLPGMGSYTIVTVSTVQATTVSGAVGTLTLGSGLAFPASRLTFHPGAHAS